MEHRKDYASPRDMLDDALLQRILSDMADNDNNQTRNRCGCSDNTRSGNDSRSDRSDDYSRSGSGRSGCGCGNTRSGNDSRSDRSDDYNRSGSGRSGCGCGNTRSGDDSRSENRNTRYNDGFLSRQDMNNDYSESGGNNCERCISGAGIPALNGFPLAMAYSPNQDWENILEPEEALSKGTLFTGLLFPWYPSRCHDNKDCGCGRG